MLSDCTYSYFILLFIILLFYCILFGEFIIAFPCKEPAQSLFIKLFFKVSAEEEDDDIFVFDTDQVFSGAHHTVLDTGYHRDILPPPSMTQAMRTSRGSELKLGKTKEQTKPQTPLVP